MHATSKTSVRAATAADADAIARIYNHYVLDTVVTFEEQPVSSGQVAARMEDVVAAELPWLVGEREGQIVGYAYAAQWKPRRGYRFSVEITVYLDPMATGLGAGTRLYEALFEILRRRSIHTVIGGIALPNPASVALHEKLGMRKVAHFAEVGIKFNRWIDVGYWQTTL